MASSKEELRGLPEMYLSPTRTLESNKYGTSHPSDAEHSVWEDTDSEVWTALVPEMTAVGGLLLNEDISGEDDSQDLSLGQREEIEGDSSVDSVNRNSFAVGRSKTGSYPQRQPEGSREHSADGISQIQDSASGLNALEARDRTQWKHQRGETPGSDCPPVAGIGALSRIFRQPLELNTNTQSSKSELVFSPGGDEGFMVPGGVSAYYGTGSGSDTDGLEWDFGGGGGAQALIPVRDVVEGADNATSAVQSYTSNRPITPVGPESMERNSPAGLSTPDADIDLSFRAGAVMNNSKPKNSIRPPVVGQSEEMQVQTSRKDLGSTDGEESEDNGQKRTALIKNVSDHIPTDIQLSSLGSQSENTDSVNTVLDMSRGEVQGCETDDTLDTPLLSPSQIIEPTISHLGPKPTFVVGGPIAPRGKYKQFQNTVRGRMQDVMASLEVEPSSDTRMYVDRDQFLSQPPLCPPVALVSEQEVSLTSMISVESTNHPDSSDRVTSPSVLSVSSAASSKRLEWDSGADVGYTGNTPEQITSSLSTLERIALGSYASVLRTEPEGTTYVPEKQKIPKKSNKTSGVKSGGNAGPSRRSYQEEASALPSKSLRPQHSRSKYKLSSSEEDFDSKFLSPGNSPRRRPRRKQITLGSRKLDLPIKSVVRTKRAFGRLQEVMQELSSEGKASSLVELNQTSRPISQCRRSNSQQSLSYPSHMSDRRNEAVSNASVTAYSSTSVATTVCHNTKPESNLAANSSTTCMPSNVVPGSPRRQLEGRDTKTHADKKFQPPGTPFQKPVQVRSQDRVCLSSSNEVSSKSHGSSDVETLSDVKDTDGDSCPSSNLVSDEEPVNLKARKNSENAKNHENITKQYMRSAKGRSVQSHWQRRRNDDSSSSSSLQRSSLLESQVSLQSSNNSLQALSARLKERIQALLDSGTLKKVQDYNKLQDYVAFIGLPSANEEECRLKRGVAGVIMRMFGEIGADDTDASSTVNSETSGPVTPTSQTSDSKAQSLSEYTILSHEDADAAQHTETADGDECHQVVSSGPNDVVSSGERSRSVTPGGTVQILPYRPPSATRTYFMAVSCDLQEGLVEGECGVSPESDPILAAALTARQDDLRGQAEGQREVNGDDSELSSPTAYQGDFRGEKIPIVDKVVVSEENSDSQEKFASAKDWEDDESESVSAATALPQEWSNAMRSQMILSSLPGAVTSNESSPRRVGQYSTWDRRSSWHDDEKEVKDAEATSWKFATTRSERLYKDKLGTLHIAKQPPGYMDDRDSHQSESTSDHETHQPGTNDAESQEDRRPYAHPWTSSGSESAYETIRERHRHVDEALASSFEFYSTSPRDARLLGYVSSEAERGQQEEVEEVDLDERLDTERRPEPPATSNQPQPLPSEESSSKRQAVKSKKHSSSRQQHQEPHLSHETARFISSFSSYTEDNDLSSSQVSIIKLQKHRYVRRIQRYIDSLEKLERALLGEHGESIGSENSFQRYVTEGRSHTESDSNKVQTRDILGQSETASSSVVSSDFSDNESHRKAHQPRWKRKGASSRSDVLPGNHDIPHILTTKLNDAGDHGAAPPLMQSSLVSSPRVNLSQRSSDVASSRTSTLKQIEKEVRMLALAEEKSRHVMRKNLKSKSAGGGGGRNSHYHNIQRIYREEPRGEEDPTRSLAVSRRGTLDSNLSTKYSLPDQVFSEKGTTSTAERTWKAADTGVVSGEERPSRNISDSPISRQGDGRETRDTKRVIKTPPTVYSTGSSYNQTNISDIPSRRDVPPLSRTHSKQTLQRDFGQMFPSTDCIRADDYPNGQSVGIQTGTSLLCLSERESNDSTDSSRPSTGSSSNSDRHKKQGSGKQTHVKSNGATFISMRKDVSSQRKGSVSNAMGDYDKERSTQLAKVQSGKSGIVTTSGSRDMQQKAETTVSSYTKTKSGVSADGVTRGQKLSMLDQESDKEKNTHRRDQEASCSSRPNTGRIKDRTMSDHGKLSSSRSVTARSEDQPIVNLNVIYSRSNSGKSRSDSKMESSARPKSAKSGMAEANSGDDNVVSVTVVQNGTSRPDSGMATSENGYINKTGTSGSESRRLETDSTNLPPAALSSRLNEEYCLASTRAVDGRYDIPGQNEHFPKQPEHKEYVQAPQKDRIEITQRDTSLEYRNGDIQNLLRVSDVSGGQLETEEMSLEQVSQNYYRNDSGVAEQSSGMSSTYREETEVMRNAKNRLLQMYSTQLMPFRSNTSEGTMEVTISDAGSDAVGMQYVHSKRSVRNNQDQRRVNKYKEPVSFEVNVSNKENAHKNQPKSRIIYTPQGRSGVLVENAKKNFTLQEALSKARPDYMRDAGERRALIRLKQEMRQAAQTHNHEVISQIPTNLQTPSTLQRFLYKPDIAPLFSYRDIREQNRRLYQLLPEANVYSVNLHRTAQNRTNRLMAGMYSQRLRKKVLKGRVSHAHKDIVTPPSIHRK